MDKTYRKCLDALYGNGEPPTANEVKEALARRANSLSGKESDHQIKLHAWLTKIQVPHFHPANGGRRDRLEAYKLKAMGVSPGIFDIVVTVARMPFHGLYIELKREKGGIVSPAQRWWEQRLTEEGYLAVFSNSLVKSQKIVLEYLKLPKWTIERTKDLPNFNDL